MLTYMKPFMQASVDPSIQELLLVALGGVCVCPLFFEKGWGTSSLDAGLLIAHCMQCCACGGFRNSDPHL